MKENNNNKYIGWGITAVCVVAASLVIAFVINRFGVIRSWYQSVNAILAPIMYGVVFAFLMSPLYNRMHVFFLNNFEKICKKKKTAKSVSRILATSLCLIIFLLIVSGLIMMLIPQLISSIQSLVTTLPGNIQNGYNYLSTLLDDNPDQKAIVYEQYQKLYTFVTTWVSTDFLPNIDKYILGLSSGVLGVVNFIKNFAIGIIVMLYLLNIKGTLAAQAKKITYAVLPLSWANELVDECQYIREVFSKFIVGKIIDSAIIGVLCFIILSIFKIPYALLISAFVGITNVIPFFGPFIGAIPCSILLIMVSPIKAIEFIIIILVLQQFDGNILGPKILGRSTGLSSFWILFAILLFGGWFGIVGMIIGVPTFAVIYRIIGKSVNRSLDKRGLSQRTIDYWDLDEIDENNGEYVRKKNNAE